VGSSEREKAQFKLRRGWGQGHSLGQKELTESSS